MGIALEKLKLYEPGPDGHHYLVLAVYIFVLPKFISALPHMSAFLYVGDMAASKFNLADPEEGAVGSFFSVFIYQSQRRTWLVLQ